MGQASFHPLAPSSSYLYVSHLALGVFKLLSPANMDMVCIANWSGYVYAKENRADRGPKFACAQSPFRSKDFLLFAVFPLWLTATERDNGSNQKSDCVGNVIYETIIALCDL